MVRSPRRDHRRAFLSSLSPVTDLGPPSSSATLEVTELGREQPATTLPKQKVPGLLSRALVDREKGWAAQRRPWPPRLRGRLNRFGRFQIRPAPAPSSFAIRLAQTCAGKLGSS